jgi:hypothetical protein
MKYEAFHCNDHLQAAAGKVPHIVKLLYRTAVTSSEPTTHNGHEVVGDPEPFWTMQQSGEIEQEKQLLPLQAIKL